MTGSPAGEPTLADVQAQYPQWDCVQGISGMYHAEATLSGKNVKDEWSNKLYKKCLSEGGGAASDEVVKASLIEPWIRDQGFVDESANLRAKWSTLMSAETRENAIKASPTTPEPIVFTVNRMLDMAGGKGSIY